MKEIGSLLGNTSATCHTHTDTLTGWRPAVCDWTHQRQRARCWGTLAPPVTHTHRHTDWMKASRLWLNTSETMGSLLGNTSATCHTHRHTDWMKASRLWLNSSKTMGSLLGNNSATCHTHTQTHWLDEGQPSVTEPIYDGDHVVGYQSAAGQDHHRKRVAAVNGRNNCWYSVQPWCYDGQSADTGHTWCCPMSAAATTNHDNFVQ